jgi:transcriptional regulator with XRE-family HTH domain
MAFEFQTPEELLKELGTRLRAIRIHRSLEQTEVAARAGVALRTLRALELGQGSTTETLVRVLKALGALDGLEALAPTPTISPLALLKLPRPRQRVRNPQKRSDRID